MMMKTMNMATPTPIVAIDPFKRTMPIHLAALPDSTVVVVVVVVVVMHHPILMTMMMKMKHPIDWQENWLPDGE